MSLIGPLIWASNISSAAVNISSIDNNVGDTLGGDIVIINGSGFIGTTSVTFGGTNASAFTVLSDTNILAIAPAKTAGQHDVAVTTSGGSDSFTNGYRAWNPGLISGCTHFSEAPDFADSTWTRRSGATNFSQGTGGQYAPRSDFGEPWFDAVDDFLSGPTTADVFGAQTQGTSAFVFSMRDPSDPNNLFTSPSLFSDNGRGAIGANADTSGFTFYATDGTYKSATIAASRDEYHLGIGRWANGGNLDAILDGTTSSDPIGTYQTGTNPVHLGQNYGAGYRFKGAMRVVYFGSSRISDTDAGYFLSWARTRHGVRNGSAPSIHYADSNVIDPAGGDYFWVHGLGLDTATSVRIGTTSATFTKVGTHPRGNNSSHRLDIGTGAPLASSYSIFALVRARDTKQNQTTAGTPYSNDCVVSSTPSAYAYLYLRHGVAGWQHFTNGGVSKYAEVSDFAYEKLQLLQVDYDTTTNAIRMRIVGSPRGWTVTDCGTSGTLHSNGVSSNFRLMANIDATGCLNGDLLAFGISPTKLTNDEHDDVARWFNARLSMDIGGLGTSYSTAVTSMNWSRLFLDGNYSSNVPGGTATWTGTASAGTSGSNNATNTTSGTIPYAVNPSLRVLSPSLTAGTYPIYVENPSGFGTLSNALKVWSPYSITNLVWLLDASAGTTTTGTTAHTPDVYSTANQNSDNAIYNTTDSIGQSFKDVYRDSKLTGVKGYVKKVGSPTGNIYAKIYFFSGTFGTDCVPVGVPLAVSDAVDVSTLGTSYAQQLFTFSGNDQIWLEYDQPYVVALEYGGGDGSNYVDVGINLFSSPNHQGTMVTRSGATWSDSGSDMCFEIVAEYNDVTAWADQSGAADAARDVAPFASDGRPQLRTSDYLYGGKSTLGTFNKLNTHGYLVNSGTWSASYSTPFIFAIGHADAGSNRYFTFGSVTNYLGIVSASSVVLAYSADATPYISEGATYPTQDSSPIMPAQFMASFYNGASSKLWSRTNLSRPGTHGAGSLGAVAMHVGAYLGAGNTFGVRRIAMLGASSTEPNAEEIRLLKRWRDSYFDFQSA